MRPVSTWWNSLFPSSFALKRSRLHPTANRSFQTVLRQKACSCVSARKGKKAGLTFCLNF